MHLAPRRGVDQRVGGGRQQRVGEPDLGIAQLHDLRALRLRQHVAVHARRADTSVTVGWAIDAATASARSAPGESIDIRAPRERPA